MGLIVEALKRLQNGHFLENRNTQDLQKSVETEFEVELFLDDRNQDVGGHSNPDLGLDRVLGSAVEGLDPEMLFDPFEEKFHPPATLVKLGDRKGGKDEVVGQEDKLLFGLAVEVTDAPELVGIVPDGIESCEPNALIGLESCRLVDGMRQETPELKIAFGSSDEEGRSLMKSEEAPKIQITPIHHIEGTGFGNEKVEDFDIVYFPMSYLDKSRDGPTKIQERMEFDRAFLFAESGPGEKRKTKIDRGGVEGIDSLLQFDTEVFALVQRPGLMNEDLGKVGIDAPVAGFVGMGQGIAGDFASKAHLVKFALHGTQTRFDIPQALAIGHLSECHGEKLIETRKAFDFVIALVAPDAFAEFVEGQKIHHLRKDRSAGIHWENLLEG